MALYIKNPDVDRMAHELAESYNTSVTQAVRIALENEQKRAPKKQKAKPVLKKSEDPSLSPFVRNIMKIVEDFNASPIDDPRSPQEIMNDMYDEFGLPK